MGQLLPFQETYTEMRQAISSGRIHANFKRPKDRRRKAYYFTIRSSFGFSFTPFGKGKAPFGK
jgi:hypothetical protein